MRDRVLWLILATGLALRGGLVALYPYLEGWGDQHLHYVVGALVPRFGHGVLGHWPPGYEAFLGAAFAVFGPDPLAARILQVPVSLAAVALVYASARRLGGIRAGRIAAALWALDPSAIAYSHYFYSETLFATLLLAGLWPLLRAGGNPGARSCIAAGVWFGLAALTRSVALYFLPVWIGFEALRRRRAGVVGGAITLAAALAVVLPWTLRNAVRYDGFLLVDGSAGRTAYLAFNTKTFNMDLGFFTRRHEPPARRPACSGYEDPTRARLPPAAAIAGMFPPPEASVIKTRWELLRAIREARRFAQRDLIGYQACEIGRALAFAREDPVRVARHAFEKLHQFWGPNSLLLAYVRHGLYSEGPLSREAYVPLEWIVIGFHLVVGLGAILALGRRNDPPGVGGLVLFAVYYTGMHIAAVASSRYRLPLMPVLTVLASLWWARPALPERSLRGGSVILLGLAFAIAAFVYVFSVLP